MADNYVERIAGELADLALADEARQGDEKIVDQIGQMVGTASQTLEEAYMTAVRVRRAERQARALLAKRAGKPIVPLAEVIEDQSNRRDNTTVEDAEEVMETVSAVAMAIQEATPEPVASEPEPVEAELPEPEPELVEQEPEPMPDPEPEVEPEPEVAEAPEPKAAPKKRKKKLSGPWDMDGGLEEEDEEEEPQEPEEEAAPAAPRRVKR